MINSARYSPIDAWRGITYFAVLSLFISCSSVQQQLDPQIFYKRDIQLEINGKSYEGVTVVPHSDSYGITIIPPGDISLALMQTCHREYAIEKADSGWSLFGKKKKFTYLYNPVKGLEDVRVCPLRVSVFESDKGRHSWAMLEMEHPDFSIKFSMLCNGEKKEFNGVGICQAKESTTQRIKFNEPIRFAPAQNGCSQPYKKDDSYEVKASVGECLYMFDTQDKKLGRFTLIGYQGVLIREAQ